MAIKAVFFDFDYTLGNRDRYAYRLYRKIIEDNCDIEDPVELEAVVQDLMIWDQKGNVHKQYIPDMLKEHWGIILPYENFDSWWNENLHNFSLPYDDAEETLKELRSRGYLIGLISNGVSEEQRLKLEFAGLTDLVDSITVSGDIGIGKPDVRLFRHAMEKLGVTPEESMMVGDIFAKDVLGAKRAGMTPVWFCVQPEMPLEADVIRIYSLRELLNYL